MKCRYSVTFEFDLRPCLTLEGTVQAGQAHVCAARAIKIARETLRPVAWRSLVCVLLERLPDGKETDELDQPIQDAGSSAPRRLTEPKNT